METDSIDGLSCSPSDKRYEDVQKLYSIRGLSANQIWPVGSMVLTAVIASIPKKMLMAVQIM